MPCQPFSPDQSDPQIALLSAWVIKNAFFSDIALGADIGGETTFSLLNWCVSSSSLYTLISAASAIFLVRLDTNKHGSQANSGFA